MNEDDQKKIKKKQNSKGLFENSEQTKSACKRLRSSIIVSKSSLNTKKDYSRSRTNPIKIMTKRNINKRRSFDDNILKVCQYRYKLNKVESNIINKLKRKIRSLSSKKNVIIDNWKNKFEK